MDCTTLLQDSHTLRQLETVCRKRFGDAAEADECFLFILEKCREDDFHRLRAFLGKSSLKTYLYTLFNNLAADFKRARFGRRRIPKVVCALGAWAEEVYRLVCWQRYSYEDAWEIASLNILYTDTFNRLDLGPMQAQRRLKKILTGFREALLREGINFFLFQTVILSVYSHTGSFVPEHRQGSQPMNFCREQTT